MSGAMWVAQGPLAELLQAEMQRRSLSRHQLAEISGLDRRTCRDVLTGRGTGGWVRVETAERLLRAAGCPEALTELEVVIAASRASA